MKKRVIVFFIIILFSIVTFIPVLLDSKFTIGNPLESRFNFSYPSYAIKNFDKGIIAIDNGLSRITSLSPDNTINWQIEGGKREKGYFFASEIATDANGYIYVLNQVMMSEGFRTQREEILRFTSGGDFDRILYSYTYTPEEQTNLLVTRGKWLGLHVKNNYIQWYQLDQKGIVESKIQIDTLKMEQNLVAPINDSAIYVSSVIRIDDSRLAYITKAGEIRIADSNGNDHIVYSSDEASVTGKTIPWWIKISSDGRILFSDLGRRSIQQLNSDSTVTTIFSDALLKLKTNDDYPYVYYTFSNNTPNELVTVNDIQIVVISDNGTVQNVISGGTYTPQYLFVRVLFIVSILLFITSFIFLLNILYTQVFKKRVSIITKQLLIILPLMIAILAFVSFYLLDSFSNRNTQHSLEQISQTIQLITASFNTDDLQRITKHSDFMNDDYKAVRTYIHTSLNFNKDPWNSKIYFALYRIKDGTISAMMYLNDGVSPEHPFSFLNDPTLSFWKAARGSIVCDTATDAWGSWVFGVGPIYDKTGNVIALLEIGRDMYSFKQDNQKIISNALPFIIASFVFLGIVFIVFTWFFMRTLQTLRTGVMKISEGDWNTVIPVKGHDEVAELTLVFNKMTMYIRNYIEEIVSLSQGYQRFVPKEFLAFLDRQSVTDIVLGDQIQREMSIMFSDIRGFTTLSEAMTPDENFEFLNQYLGIMGPQVRQNGGFIDKYIGDAIMALFPLHADDAVQTAIDILDLLQTFNKDRQSKNQVPIQIGLGIHTGRLMLGILGEPERFDGTVISDNVNLASRVEGLTKYFDAPILCTEETYRKLENPDKYLIRNLGLVKVVGKKETIRIYEILDGSPSDVKSKKIQCYDNLAKGILAYQERRFDEGIKFLEASLVIYPQDVPSKIYLTLSKQAQTLHLNDKWIGALVMESK